MIAQAVSPSCPGLLLPDNRAPRIRLSGKAVPSQLRCKEWTGAMLLIPLNQLVILPAVRGPVSMGRLFFDIRVCGTNFNVGRRRFKKATIKIVAPRR
jgi:hypothetical protein